MKIKELKPLTTAELVAKRKEFDQELFNLRLRQSTGQLDQPSRLREVRKDIARVETLLSQARLKTAAPTVENKK